MDLRIIFSMSCPDENTLNIMKVVLTGIPNRVMTNKEIGASRNHQGMGSGNGISDSLPYDTSPTFVYQPYSMVMVNIEPAKAQRNHHFIFAFEAIKVPRVCMTSFAITA